MQSLVPWLWHCWLPVQRGPRKAELLVLLLLLLLLLVQRLLAEEPGQARACWEWFQGTPAVWLCGCPIVQGVAAAARLVLAGLLLAGLLLAARVVLAGLLLLLLLLLLLAMASVLAHSP